MSSNIQKMYRILILREQRELHTKSCVNCNSVRSEFLSEGETGYTCSKFPDRILPTMQNRKPPEVTKSLTVYMHVIAYDCAYYNRKLFNAASGE